MNFIIGFFQNRLECSWEVATVRVRRTILLLVVALAFMVIAAFLFRITEHSSQKSVDLLPGEHTVVSKIINSDVVVDRGDFVDLAADNPSFVAQTRQFVSYLAVVDGVRYRSDLGLGTGWLNPISESSLSSGGLVLGDQDSTGESTAWTLLVVIFGIVLALYLLLWALGYKEEGRMRFVWWGQAITWD